MPSSRTPPQSLPTGEEVLFLTSRTRLFNAFLKWYNHSYPGNDANYENATVMSRQLMRHLRVPSAEEIAAFRKEQLPDD